ncbi:MAG: radical SAM protein [Clostridium sp.]|nr:radical SAM protein [Clostridium sp.]
MNMKWKGEVMIRDKVNRTKLEEAIPINTPFVCHVEVTNVCNFRCEFCASVDNPAIKNVKKGFMEYSLFCKIVDDLCEFDGRLKQMVFHLLGEPLMHPQIVDMIVYAKKKNVSQKLIMYTNGDRLTPEVSRMICDAGIDYIQFSIEHINSEGYEKITRTKVDYDKLLANIGYLCAYKSSECFVSAKILDCGLTEADKTKFYSDFEKITDECHIEVPMQVLPESVRDTTFGNGQHTTNDGYALNYKDVCTPPFYLLGIACDGLVSPCECDWSKSICIGDVNKQSLKQIWNGENRKNFLKMQLAKQRSVSPICGKCKIMYNQLDNIDEYAEKLYEKLNN